MTAYLTEELVGLLFIAALFIWVGKFRGGDEKKKLPAPR